MLRKQLLGLTLVIVGLAGPLPAAAVPLPCCPGPSFSKTTGSCWAPLSDFRGVRMQVAPNQANEIKGLGRHKFQFQVGSLTPPFSGDRG